MARLVPVAALSTLLLLLLTPTASATHVRCGDVITTDTTLDSDLIDCPGDGVVIAADGVTLDLNGHLIDGTGTGTGVSADRGTSRFLRDLAVRDGVVSEFRYGINIEDVSNVTVADVRATGNASTAIRCVFSGGCQFVDNVVVRNGGGMGISISEFAERPNVVAGNLVAHNGSGLGFGYAGVDVTRNRIIDNVDNGITFGAAGGRVEGNSIGGNAGYGIFFFDLAGGDVVGNDISANGLDGVLVAFFAEPRAITDNTIERNGGNGINVREEGGRDTVVARNRLTRNVLDGILIQFGANPIEVKGNRSDRNGDDGIDADEPATTVAASRADHNVDLGIEAVPGVIDGSGNRAKHNGNPLQCLNVVCRR